MCTSCWEADQAKPYWDSENKKCTSCAESASADGTLWDPEKGKCVKECPELTKDGICRRCYDLDPMSPYWDSGEKRCRACSDAFGSYDYSWNIDLR